MPDIFLSYNREDQAVARHFAEAFEREGFSVWWDVSLRSGEAYDKITEDALNDARAVVVLWSPRSVGSRWVRAEATEADRTNKFIPVMIEDCKRPIMFELTQTAVLTNWLGDRHDKRWLAFLADVRAFIQRQPPGRQAPRSSGAPAEAPVTRRGEILRRPAVLGGLVAAALALVVTVTVLALRPPESSSQVSPTSQLIAFFEYTPTGDDLSLKATAEAATDRMFQSMGGWKNFLSTVARTETRGTPENLRFARAAELGARYVLGGEVRQEADGVTLSVRFEDVSSRLTLWENSFSAPASDVAYLPAQATLKTAQIMWCIVKTRSELTRDSTALLNLIADRCRGGAITNERNASYTVSRMRAVTEADPGSAYNLAQLVAVLSGGSSAMPASARAAWIAEAETTLQRAAKLDPDEPNLLWGRVALEQAKGVPVTEFGATTLDVAAKADGKDAYVFGNANYNRAMVLQATGQFRDALPHIVIAVANDTLRPPWAAGPYYATLGRRAQARAEIEPALAAYGAWVWEPMIPYAIFLDAADAEAMLKTPPSTIPKATVGCLRDIRDALVSKNPAARALGAKKARACAAAETLSPMTVLASLAALNDLDAAFALADQLTFNASSLSSEMHQVLFWPASRPMRDDPRFLPLVEKLGMLDYWRTTRSQPDLCETETAPFCKALKGSTDP